MRLSHRPCLLLCLLCAAAGGCGDGDEATPRIEYTEDRDPCAEYNPERKAFFGDLHVHTGHSFDARGYDVRATPTDAYRFARGEPLALPPFDSQGRGTRPVQLGAPLDFAAVTDHQEFIGEIRLCLDAEVGSVLYESDSCRRLRAHTDTGVAHFGMLTASTKPRRLEDVCGEHDCENRARQVWLEIQEAAEAAYDRSAACEFVSFVGYEYTNSGNVTNLHRNVLFRNDRVPELPPSYFEQTSPVGLWRELEASCLDAGTGCEVMAIPHNSNWSNGTLFDPEYPGARTPEDEPAEAAFRLKMEPLVEIFQHKGAMECSNRLDGVTPDPLCDFEEERKDDWEDCGDEPGLGGISGFGCMSRLDFVRHVLQAGLEEERRIGVNPYKLGVIGSTDGHNAIPGMVDEAAWIGHVGLSDDTAEERLGNGNMTHRGIVNNPGGLAGIWAEERSRDALWLAMQRKETFATSGTRIVVRLFGGWDFPRGWCEDADRDAEGYRLGAPMGGDLPARSGGAAPSFAVWAAGDPRSAPLQRIQIVKGWLDAAGEPREAVFHVAGDAEGSATVDTETCETSGDGFDTLCSVWSDPEFDPARPAFYYARVVENPVCRWSTRLCNTFAPDAAPPRCADERIPETIQERAWSSPIWFTPETP